MESGCQASGFLATSCFLLQTRMARCGAYPKTSLVPALHGWNPAIPQTGHSVKEVEVGTRRLEIRRNGLQIRHSRGYYPQRHPSMPVQVRSARDVAPLRVGFRPCPSESWIQAAFDVYPEEIQVCCNSNEAALPSLREGRLQ